MSATDVIRAVDLPRSCSAWCAVNVRRPLEADAPHELVWWWVPGMDEAVADFYDLPDESTHWMPWEPEMLPPAGPNKELTD